MLTRVALIVVLIVAGVMSVNAGIRSTAFMLLGQMQRGGF
jgi:hypothetical protein